MVKKAREGVMEFLLINHPLDCPVCDQGGECDLQDQAMAYGIDKNRFGENKRAVEDKYLGPLIRTFMNRCIQCTRCIRFSSEVAGIDELGAIGRGEDMEITTYLERAMMSELQGNVIDLCPVGALVSAPYSMKARPWELRKTESVDVMDGLGSAIRVDVRDRRVMRILPRRNDEVNEEWISDKTRFVWDGLMAQRLDRPYVRQGGVRQGGVRQGGRLRPASWGEAFGLIAERFKAAGPERTACLMGDVAGVEEMFALKSLMRALDVKHVDCREPHSALGEAGGRAGYLFNATVAGIERADAIVLVGSNPRQEAAVLNARIRKVWRATGLPIGVIGETADLTYPYLHLGAGPQSLVELIEGRGAFAKVLEKAERPLIVLGQGAIARPDGKAVLAHAAKLALQCGAVSRDWNGFSVLHTVAARVGGLEICALPASDGGKSTAEILSAAKSGEIAAVYLLGVDEIDMAEFGDAFLVYQGTHGDAGAQRADVVLPGAAYTEKSATFVNTEGRPQMTRRGAFPPGDARDDWAIIRALSEVLGATLAFDNLDQLRAKLYETVPHLARIDAVEPADPAALAELAKVQGDMAGTPFASPVSDYFLTNPIARASRIMAECSALRAGLRLEAAE
jgi:NADH-quinone oxidoreductase subunit G